MGNEMRLLKFETFIKDINLEIRTSSSGVYFGHESSLNWAKRFRIDNGFDDISSKCNNKGLLLIYNYSDLNEYGKIILEQSSMLLKDWENKYSEERLINNNVKIEAAKELIRYCRSEDNRREAYKFIFWSMMVLSVNKSQKEEKLSLICDFARMLQISDAEMLDLVKVIKVLFHKESKRVPFQSDIVQKYFSTVLKLYNK